MSGVIASGAPASIASSASGPPPVVPEPTTNSNDSAFSEALSKETTVHELDPTPRAPSTRSKSSSTTPVTPVVAPAPLVDEPSSPRRVRSTSSSTSLVGVEVLGASDRAAPTAIEPTAASTIESTVTTTIEPMVATATTPTAASALTTTPSTTPRVVTSAVSPGRTLAMLAILDAPSLGARGATSSASASALAAPSPHHVIDATEPPASDDSSTATAGSRLVSSATVTPLARVSDHLTPVTVTDPTVAPNPSTDTVLNAENEATARNGGSGLTSVADVSRSATLSSLVDTVTSVPPGAVATPPVLEVSSALRQLVTARGDAARDLEQARETTSPTTNAAAGEARASMATFAATADGGAETYAPRDDRRSPSSPRPAASTLVSNGVAASTPVASSAATSMSSSAVLEVVVGPDGLSEVIARPLANGDGSYSVEVSLHPAELGHVQAVLSLDHNVLGVVLTPSTSAGHEALTSQLDALQSELAKDGLNVNVTLRDPSNGSGEHSPRPQPRAATLASPVADASQTMPPALAGQIHVVL